MIRIVFAAVVALGMFGCTTLAPGAAQVVVSSDVAAVQGCKPLGTVSGATAQFVGFDDPAQRVGPYFPLEAGLVHFKNWVA